VKRFLGLCTAALIIFFSLSPAAFSMGRKPAPFEIEVKVDFGPAGKPAHSEKILVEKGTTPKEAVSQVFPVLSGKTCCSFREIMEIGGVRVSPAKNRWWTCAVNGSKKVSPQKTKLKKGDVVEWVYIQDEQ
jgi:hypothetical protein